MLIFSDLTEDAAMSARRLRQMRIFFFLVSIRLRVASFADMRVRNVISTEPESSLLVSYVPFFPEINLPEQGFLPARAHKPPDPAFCRKDRGCRHFFAQTPPAAHRGFPGFIPIKNALR